MNQPNHPPPAERWELRTPRHPVNRRAVYWWMLQALVFNGGIAAVALAVRLIWPSTAVWSTPALVLALLVLLVALFVEPFWRYRVHRWETSEHAVYARSGWLVREWRAAPLSRAQTIDAIQGPLEQMLGLATLRVTTASSGGAINIVGLDHATAQRTATELTRIAELTEGDAT